MTPAWAEVDLSAVRHNVGVLRAAAGSAEVMAVVKADAYGHGLVPCARAAREGGAAWLGTAFVEEGLALRAAGDTGPLLAWLHTPSTDFAAAVAAGIDLSASTPRQLAAIAAAGAASDAVPRVHLKADTGLSRGGATEAEWEALVGEAARASSEGRVEVVALWSHLSHGDEPDHATVDAQAAAFGRACAAAAAAGLGQARRHLANSGAALARPDLAFDIVRPGIAAYGLSPGPALGTPAALGLRPAMTLRTTVAQVKEVPAGTGVSYSHRYATRSSTRLALVPIGYADGIPRSATNVGPLRVGGQRTAIAGTVCMDQVVVDLGPESTVAEGDPVVVFGPGGDGEPTVRDWADACGTIEYEIVTRIGPRVGRVYVEGGSA